MQKRKRRKEKDAQVTNWLNQQTEAERQEEEAEEKERVWRTHLLHNSDLLNIEGFNGPTLTCSEYLEITMRIHNEKHDGPGIWRRTYDNKDDVNVQDDIG